MPSIIVSLGIGLEFRLIDAAIKWLLERLGAERAAGELRHRARPVHVGARRAPHLDAALRPADHVRRLQPLQSGLRGSGARPRRDAVAELPPGGAAADRAVGGRHRHVRLHAVSWDEIARTSQAIGDVNTLPLELQGLTTTVTTPAIYALGTVTTLVSLLVIALTLIGVTLLRRLRRTLSQPIEPIVTIVTDSHPSRRVRSC